MSRLDEYEPEDTDDDSWAMALEEDFLDDDQEPEANASRAEDSARLLVLIGRRKAADTVTLDAVVAAERTRAPRKALADAIAAAAFLTAERTGGDPEMKAEAAADAAAPLGRADLVVTLRRRLEALIGLLKPDGVTR